MLSRVQLFEISWTVAYQGPPSMEFSRQEYWSGLSFPSPEDLPDPGIEPCSPTLQADALPSGPPGKPRIGRRILLIIMLVQVAQTRTTPGKLRTMVILFLKAGVSVHAQLLSCMGLSETPGTVACHAFLSMKFSRQEYWSRLPFPAAWGLSCQGTEPKPLALAGGFLTAVSLGKPLGGSERIKRENGYKAHRTKPDTQKVFGRYQSIFDFTTELESVIVLALLFSLLTILSLIFFFMIKDSGLK